MSNNPSTWISPSPSLVVILGSMPIVYDEILSLSPKAARVNCVKSKISPKNINPAG